MFVGKNYQDHQPLSLIQKVVVLSFILVAGWYLNWRLTVFNPDAPIFSLIFYLAELFGFVTALLHIFMLWRLTKHHSLPAEKGLSVDVFVPTLNEPVDLIRKTLRAAQNMDYPHETWLLDDGNRSEMKDLAKELGCAYIMREKNSHGKAGNLNNALEKSNADYIAIFDSDHAPKRDFLTKTLGYFRNKNVAFVQTPQDFYNLDSYQHRWRKQGKLLWTEQSLFFRVIQRGKDYWNAAFYCGSCAILRRSALDKIGGFATGTVTEDLHTSLRLHKQGFKSVYHAESLAFGQAALSLEPFITQRVRWGAGAMNVWREEGIVTAKGLTIPQRLCYLASVLTYFEGWQRCLFYIAPAIVLLFGSLPIASLNGEFLIHFIPFYLLAYWTFEETSRGYGNLFYIEQYNMARFGAFMWATLWFFRKQRHFRVTPKINNGRIWADRYLTPQYIVFIANLAAIFMGLYYLNVGSHLSFGGIAANIFWGSVNFMFCALMLAFTFQQPRRRSEYRFPVPLPARISVNNKSQHEPYCIGMVQDLSTKGFRMTLPNIEPKDLYNNRLSGMIFLPDGPLPFKVDVKSTQQTKSLKDQVNIGCRFLWDSSPDPRLELLLYGSDLQWRLHGLAEKSLTPVQVLTSLFSKNSSSRYIDLKKLTPVLCKINGDNASEHLLGMATPETLRHNAKLVLFSRVAPQSTIDIYNIGSGNEYWQRHRISDIEQIDGPQSPIFISKLTRKEDVTDAVNKDFIHYNTTDRFFCPGIGVAIPLAVRYRN